MSIRIIFVKGADLEMPYADAETAEDICLRLCRSLNFLPIAKSIFGLRIYDSVGTKNIWLASNSKLYPDRKYEFRIRFKVSSLSRLLAMDKKVYDYYFHQARNDILRSQVPEINYRQHKDELLGLAVADMYRAWIEENVLIEELKRIYKKYTPREVLKKHSIFAKKLIFDSLDRFQRTTCDEWDIKTGYLEQLGKLAPNYLSEEYSATIDSGRGVRSSVHLNVAPYHALMPGLQVSYDGKKEWEHLCSIQELVSISKGTDNTIEISRTTGISVNLTFHSEVDTYSFLSLLDGYYRLTLIWTFNLCNEVPTPSLKVLRNLKCHGPFGGQFSYAKLAEIRNNKHGCFIIRECERSYDTYYIDACSDRQRPETFKVIFENNKWILYIDVDVENKSYDSLSELIRDHKQSSKRPYLAECIPPSERDKSPLLLCEPKTSVDSMADESDFTENHIRPHCINPADIQYYKDKIKDTSNGIMCYYRARWKIAKGKQMEVVMKVLKSEYTNENLKEFNEMCGKWAFVKNQSLVRLYGVTLANPISMVMEYLQLGALDEYIRNNKKTIEEVDMVEAGAQLATALWHLQDSNIVHGKIRCCKLLVASHESNLRVKLACPGLHVNYSEKDAHWIPPECYVNNFQYASNASVADVWAFATTLWEIFSLKQGITLPHWKITVSKEFYETQGRRLPKPEFCPEQIYALMLNCWIADPYKRLQGHEVMRDMNQLLYEVFNSRKNHAYETVFPKPFNDANSSKISLLSTATDDTCITRDLTSACDMERESNKSISPDFSPQNNHWSQNMQDKDDVDTDIASFLSSLPVSKSVNSMDNMQYIIELGRDCNLIPQGRIGEGFYGEVYRGSLERGNDSQVVAFKKLKACVDIAQEKDFQREINIMLDLKHPNIVQIMCVVNDCLVMEYVKHGSLLSYLKINRCTIQTPQLLKYALDIAQGMDYLGREPKNIVHRDLAARNILVASENLVKISDFGLAQATAKQGDYYILQTHRYVPIKWYAPESLSENKFSSRSDVWSYGVTMFEMFSYGKDPVLPSSPSNSTDRLDDISVNSGSNLLENGEGDRESGPPQHIMLDKLKRGIRLPPPERCDIEIYRRLMTPCWEYIPADRVTFSQLSAHAKDLLQHWILEMGDS